MCWPPRESTYIMSKPSTSVCLPVTLFSPPPPSLLRGDVSSLASETAGHYTMEHCGANHSLKDLEWTVLFIVTFQLSSICHDWPS